MNATQTTQLVRRSAPADRAASAAGPARGPVDCVSRRRQSCVSSGSWPGRWRETLTGRWPNPRLTPRSTPWPPQLSPRLPGVRAVRSGREFITVELETGEPLEIRVADGIADADAAAWDACADGNPFVRHGFLSALEDSGSVGPETGWRPVHLLAFRGGQLVGGAPLYLKVHSMGEYVFDNAWAEAYARAGGRYYPKLQCCSPFSPVTGPRLLARPGPESGAVAAALARAIATLADRLGVSSAHVTFNTSAEAAALEREGFLSRVGVQFHFENANYGSFEAFLAALKQPKRKNIRQERKGVENAGLTVKRLRGAQIEGRHWDAFYEFYLSTVDKKWGQAYLTKDFFPLMHSRLGDAVLLVIAEDSAGTLVAGALNLIGPDCLYGRNWGCSPPETPGLHFELCYYQAIEAAIELGLPRVEAGAQGEHKLSRGYLPRRTHSCHYVRDPGLRSAVAAFLESEASHVGGAIAGLTESSPFKPGAAAGDASLNKTPAQPPPTAATGGARDSGGVAGEKKLEGSDSGAAAAAAADGPGGL